MLHHVPCALAALLALGGCSKTPSATSDSGAAPAEAGDTSGDVNRDGRDDLLMGAPGSSDNPWREGSVYLLLSDL